MQKHGPNNRCAHARGKQASVKLNTTTCSLTLYLLRLSALSKLRTSGQDGKPITSGAVNLYLTNAILSNLPWFTITGLNELALASLLQAKLTLRNVVAYDVNY